MITAGDKIRIKPVWQDAGDDKIEFIAVDDESKGRVTIEPQLGLAINPTQVVDVAWIERVGR